MIHIIGTSHSQTQFWSDAIRNDESCDTNSETVSSFEGYLREAATSLQATAIAEEMSKVFIESIAGGMSVAKKIATELQLRHIFCDPNYSERRELGITTGDQREAIWVFCIRALCPNSTSIIFVCGADHSTTFHSRLELSGILTRIHCNDWTLDRPERGRQ